MKNSDNFKKGRQPYVPTGHYNKKTMVQKMDNQQKVKHIRNGIWVRFALTIIYIFFISGTYIKANNAAASDDSLYEDRTGLQWWYNSASQTYWGSETEYLNYFDNKITNFADRIYDTIHTSAELSVIHGNEAHEPANGPSQDYNHYDNVVSRIKNGHLEFDEKDQDRYTRLLLLCFGIVGIIGVRRTVKKSSPAQKIIRREAGFTGFKTTV